MAVVNKILESSIVFISLRHIAIAHMGRFGQGGAVIYTKDHKS